MRRLRLRCAAIGREALCRDEAAAITQQAIVFTIFVMMFAGFALFLPGFLTPTTCSLLQNVAILGILGLGMAIVVIGRGIDISMVATLAVPPGLVLQLVQDGHSVLAAFCRRRRCSRSPSAWSMAG